MTTALLEKAARLFLDRQARVQHPDGHFDKGGRFHLSESELRPCCRAIRNPSRAWPYSEMVHARTLKHVSALFGVPIGDVRKAIKSIGK